MKKFKSADGAAVFIEEAEIVAIVASTSKDGQGAATVYLASGCSFPVVGVTADIIADGAEEARS